MGPTPRQVTVLTYFRLLSVTLLCKNVKLSGDEEHEEQLNRRFPSQELA
jgi:hypothetical protein